MRAVHFCGAGRCLHSACMARNLCWAHMAALFTPNTATHNTQQQPSPTALQQPSPTTSLSTQTHAPKPKTPELCFQHSESLPKCKPACQRASNMPPPPRAEMERLSVREIKRNQWACSVHPPCQPRPRLDTETCKSPPPCGCSTCQSDSNKSPE